MDAKSPFKRVLILGPTAVGKTALTERLYSTFNTPIISVDSRQSYRFLNIGTAKPSCSFLMKVPHLNLSLLHPSEKDSVYSFSQRRSSWEKDLFNRFDTLFYVGGSTLYLQSILGKFDEVPPANQLNLEKLEHVRQSKGIETLFHQLKEVDPGYASQMDGFNTQRIFRALDVWMQTGKPFSSFHSQHTLVCPDDTLVIGLFREREHLVERIHQRVDEMIQMGLIDEVHGLLKMGLNKTMPGLNTVGYSEVFAFLENEMNYTEMIERIKQNTRQYAKRQMTWFKRWPFIHWLDAGLGEDDLYQNVIKLLQK